MFVAPSKLEYDTLVRMFIEIAENIGLTVAHEKTDWGTTRLVFLGILIIGDKQLLSILEDK